MDKNRELTALRRGEEEGVEAYSKDLTKSEPVIHQDKEEVESSQQDHTSAGPSTARVLRKEDPERTEEYSQLQQQPPSQIDEIFPRERKTPFAKFQSSTQDEKNSSSLTYPIDQQTASDLEKLKDYPKYLNNNIRVSTNNITSTQRPSDYSYQQGYPYSFSKDKAKAVQRKEAQSNDVQNMSTSSEKQTQSKLKSSISMPNHIRSLNSSGVIRDPSVLVSEFSYFAPGGVIPRSKRKLHDDPLDVPGPGHYDADNLTFRGSPQTFSKTERADFNKSKLEIPGPSQYYPVKHFTSNFA